MTYLIFIFHFAAIPIQDLRVAEEFNGRVNIEAEHYYRQRADSLRRWQTITIEENPSLAGAGGDAWLYLLPDTRITHEDPLIHGENFSNTPGAMAILDYLIHFNTPGRYFVWVRAWSEGSEDNGLHVGLEGLWPQSGARMQWCEGKHAWTWASRQRTEREHCGEERLIYLDIQNTGLHRVSFSMREDGFRFDAFSLSLDYTPPVDKDTANGSN